MKRILPWVLFLVACVSGQRISASIPGLILLPGSMISIKASASEQNIGAVIFLQAEHGDLLLSWSLQEQDLPRQWQLNVCDNVGCHLTLPESQILEVIRPTDKPWDNPLKIMLKPNRYAGRGWVNIDVRDQKAKNAIVNLRYEFVIE